MDCEGASAERARKILRGRLHSSGKEMFELAIRLIDEQQFGLARRLLLRARKSQELSGEAAVKARQRHALATYKDPDLPVSSRLQAALGILEEEEDLAATTSQESLGIAGAIFKRRWEASTRVSDLEAALTYYRRGSEQGTGDNGYTAVNAAFVLDLLSDAESFPGVEGGSDAGSAPRREEADEIRQRIVGQLSARAEEGSQDPWLQATLGEACLGLGRFSEAERWLRRCRESPHLREWQLESAARQIGALCILRARDSRGDIDPGAKRALRALLGEHREAITTAYAGKVGLALSGGGFRAALFHIGVLARLAELDMLRHVEVLSCVSGGSIVGAFYYLQVKQMLEERDEKELTRADYIRLVEDLEQRFLAAVQKNIRMRVVGNPVSNLKAMFSSRWTRTDEAGRQYENHFYLPLAAGRERIALEDLLIQPSGEGERDGADRPTFNPRRDNWKRRCKVPILVINASTLNTGHNWQFTASWMGEPPAVVDEDIDPNPRLRRMYHSEAPIGWRDVSLGTAVAASACVPGLFEPLVMEGLFDDISVELVDGGVHDNQGVASLIEQECSVLIVSDASGQMAFEPAPGKGPVSVPLRSSSVLSARVREAQLRDLLARRSSSALRGLMLVHLRKSLAEAPRDWKDCPEPYAAEDDVGVAAAAESSGMPHPVQIRLARMRTDLDSFSDAEAWSLMLSGYRMAKASFPTAISGFPTDPPVPGKWKFLSIAGAVDEGGEGDARLLKILDVGAERWLKVWALYPLLRRGTALLAIVGGLALAYLLWVKRRVPLLTVGVLLAALIVAFALLAVRKLLSLKVEPVGGLMRIAIGFGLLLCTPLAFLQVHVLDRLYLRAGRLEES